MGRAARRDSNDPELVKYARSFDVFMYCLNDPFDWLSLWRRQWDLIEIKDPKKRGHKHEFTPKQQELMAEVTRRGGQILVWRTKDDVDRYVATVQ